MDATDTEVEGPLKLTVEAKIKELLPRFEQKDPPQIKDFLYEVLSALRTRPTHEANDVAQQTLQVCIRFSLVLLPLLLLSLPVRVVF